MGTVVNCTCYSINRAKATWNYITYRTEALNISQQEQKNIKGWQGLIYAWQEWQYFKKLEMFEAEFV